MILKMAISDLHYGDQFVYNGKQYMLIDFSLADVSLTTRFPQLFCALDLHTYKIVCFDQDWEVDLQDS